MGHIQVSSSGIFGAFAQQRSSSLPASDQFRNYGQQKTISENDFSVVIYFWKIMFLVICSTEQLHPVLFQILKLEAIITMKLFQISYKIFCFGLFIYQAGRCIDQYVNQEPVSMRNETEQEDYPQPQICISTEK